MFRAALKSQKSNCVNKFFIQIVKTFALNVFLSFHFEQLYFLDNIFLHVKNLEPLVDYIQRFKGEIFSYANSLGGVISILKSGHQSGENLTWSSIFIPTTLKTRRRRDTC